ncbi:hypothetical protein [Maridesulfovibrio sp.]|uniref:hypothetical protein n=1 Tax=Maridesulfovibrio sp. TaxID=2795000 RepID=UPI0029F5CBA6|nr:hypothetical protein [Maridesulfovibrio sp.]
MSGSVRRILRAAMFSLVLVPVCVVFAGDSGISWRVRFPVIQPVSNWSERAESGTAAFVPDLKLQVNKVTLTAEPFEPVGEQGAVVRAVVPDDVVRKRVAASIEVADSSSAADTESPDAKLTFAANDTGSPVAGVTPHEADQPEQKVHVPSVSLVPSESARVKEAIATGDSSFFTTPKRAVGLSGKVVKVKPIIKMRELYDSNVDYKEFDDFVTEITPALKIDIFDEDWKINLRGDFIYRDYLDHSELDRYDYDVNLSGSYQFTPAFKGGLDLSHKRYHNLDQNTFEAGGVDLDPTVILKTTATPSITWAMGEKDNLVVSNYLDKTDYERKLDSDYVTNALSIVWGHALDNERTTLYLGEMNTFTHFSREIDDFKSDQLSFQGVVGLDHQFTEALKLSVKGGPGMTFSNYSSDTVTGDSVDYLYQFRAELGYRELEFSVVPALERIVRPGRYGENEVFDQAELYFRYEFTKYFTLDNINTYWMNESDGQSGGRKHKAKGMFSQSIFNWVFKEDWIATFGFSVNMSLNERSGTNSERFKTWVGFSYAFPTEIN